MNDTPERQRLRLRALEDAYDSLVMGQGVARVATSEGKVVEYQPADLPRLEREILAARAALAQGGPVRSPIYFG